VLYWEEDLGVKKVVVAKKKLSRLNPTIEITPICTEITEENVDSVIDGAQVVVDGLDRLNGRLVLNAACVKQRTPYVYGGVSRLRGMVTTIIPGETPCLACFHPEGPQGLGVLGITPALIANLQALETVKLITGQRPSLAGRLLLFNGNDMKCRVYDIKKNERCNVCSQKLLS
jgi:adenylyltransferase/sulfurtransferase